MTGFQKINHFDTFYTLANALNQHNSEHSISLYYTFTGMVSYTQMHCNVFNLHVDVADTNSR